MGVFVHVSTRGYNYDTTLYNNTAAKILFLLYQLTNICTPVKIQNKHMFEIATHTFKEVVRVVGQKKGVMVMQKIIALLLVLVFLFSATALAEGKLKATEKNLLVSAGDDNGYFYAKVENVGDVAVGVDSGDLVIFSEDDEIILSDSYITTLPSYAVLQPGDYLYVKEFLWDSALKNAAIGDYKFSVPMRKSTATYTKFPCEASFELDGVDSYENYIYVTFTNTLEEPIYDFYIVVALHDADGNLVFVDSNSLSNVAIHPGSTVTVEFYVDSDLMGHYKMNNIVPATVDAMVLFPNE